jgi:FixJ family two-component response regulator
MNRSLLVHVLDDDSAVRDSLSELLRTTVFNVLTQNCATDFFNVFRPEETACVLTDRKMPDAPGAE